MRISRLPKRGKPLFIRQLQSVDELQCELYLPWSARVSSMQEGGGNSVLCGKDIDSNSFSYLNELRRVALKAVLRDLDPPVVAIEQVERLCHQLQLDPVARI